MNAFFLPKHPQAAPKRQHMHRYPLDSPEVKEKIGCGRYQKALARTWSCSKWPAMPLSQEEFLSRRSHACLFCLCASQILALSPSLMPLSILRPAPHARMADQSDGTKCRSILSTTPFSGYVFKLQANMDRRHRDSMAFFRICSGRFERDLGRQAPSTWKRDAPFAPSWHGGRRENDARLCLSRRYHRRHQPRRLLPLAIPFQSQEDLISSPCPNSSPKFLPRVHPKDVGKRKSFDKGVLQLTDEGAIQLLRSRL